MASWMSRGCSRRRSTGPSSEKGYWKRSTPASSSTAMIGAPSELHRFFDGKVAKPHAVKLAIGNAEIGMFDAGNRTIAVWPLARVRVADQNAVSGSYTLRL